MALNDREFAVTAVRWLLGIQSLGSGINWWIKILPFPNMHEHIEGPVKHEILRVLIESGWMFSTAKVLEIALGLALIFNRYAVLMLVLSFPVIVMTFLLGLFPFLNNIGPFLSGSVDGPTLWASFLDMLFFGAGVFVMQVYLMSEYFGDYRQLFVVRPGGEGPGGSSRAEAGPGNGVFGGVGSPSGGIPPWGVMGRARRVIPGSALALRAPPH